MQKSYIYRVSATVVVLFIFISTVSSQSPKPLSENLSKGDSAEASVLTAKVDKLFEKWNKKDAPGCAAGISQNGKIVYSQGYGMASFADGTPITPATRFNVGSVSKQFTAMSIALLAKDKKLSLNDDIRKYLPEMPKYAAPITIRHLIHHTSGLRDYLFLLVLMGEPNLTSDEMFRVLTRQTDLNRSTGEEQLYSNTNYFLLSQIVKKVSGKSLREFTDERIFKPLGMKNSQFYDDSITMKNRAVGYSLRGNEYKPGTSDLPILVGPSGLWTSVEDLALWEENFYTAKIGGRKLINQMLTAGTLDNGDKTTYAQGLFVIESKGLTAVNHSGLLRGTFSAEFRFYPEQRFGVSVLCNSSNAQPGAIARQIADLYLESKFKPEPVNAAAAKIPEIVPTEQQLLEKVGAYYNESTDMTLRLLVKENKLIVDSGQEMPAIHTGKNQFTVTGRGQYTYFPADGKSPASLQEVIGKAKPVNYLAVESAAVLSTGQLAEYVGTYNSTDINASFEVGIKDNQLFIKFINGEPQMLTSNFKDAFLNQAREIRNLMFLRNNKKEVIAASLSYGRGVRKMPFEKVVK